MAFWITRPKHRFATSFIILYVIQYALRPIMYNLSRRQGFSRQYFHLANTSHSEFFFA